MAVLNFSEYASRPREPAGGPFAGILAECRDIVLDRLCAAMAGALQSIDEDLQQQLNMAVTDEQARLLIEAQKQLKLIGADIEQQFTQTFRRSFQQRAAAPQGKKDVYAGGMDFPLELSLVDDDQVSDEVTLHNLAKQLGNGCDAELTDLRARLAYMLGEAEVGDERDPLGPDAISTVLKEVCWRIDSTRPVKLLLLERLARRLAGDVSVLYKEINRHLVARQVLPRVRHAVKRHPRSSGHRPAGAEGFAASSMGFMADADPASLFQRLFFPAEEGAGPGLRPQYATGGTPSGEFINLLTRLQQGDDSALPEGASIPIGLEFDGGRNMLHALLEAGLAKQAGSFDALLIDVVATLFDHIFNDDRVPEAMKGLIGRLQIPVLKLALLDHGFFSNRNHPARRLINTLAQAAADWEGEFTAELPLHRTAENLVVRIQNEFVDDVQLFAACLQELEHFLAEEERKADARAAKFTQQLEQREREEIARAVAQSAVAAHVQNGAVPQAVRDFLDNAWRDVLAHAAVAGGEDGALWRCAAQAMDDLVWSVMPKEGAEARRRLVQILPALLRGLRDGLEAAGFPAQQREVFFAQLVKLHAAAVKAGMAPAAAQPPGPAAAPEPPRPEVRPEPERPSPAMAVVADLARGCWMDIRDDDGELRRVRLSWISPARTMYLFTNRQGERAMALSQVELAGKLAAGLATPSDDRPLIDRIVEDVVDGVLDAAPAIP